MNDEVNNEIIEALFHFFKAMKPSMSYDSRTSHLTMLQFEALHLIKKSEDAQMTDIAEHFSIRMPSATALIDKLIEMKFVVRKNDTKDRRIVKIYITKQGDKLLDEAMRQRTSKINKLLSFLSKKEKEDLLVILKKVISKI